MLFRHNIWFNALLINVTVGCSMWAVILILKTSATWVHMLFYSLKAIKHNWRRKRRRLPGTLEFRSSTETSTALTYKMHPISHPGQVCLVRPGWYERCVAFVQQASHRGLLQPLCSAHVWLWFRERDMIDSPDGALQLFSYSVQCGSRSPCRCCRLWVCIHRHTDTKSFTCSTLAHR